MKRAAAPFLAPALMTMPQMMRLGFRMSFLALEFQLTLAARLWGLSRKVQEDARAIAADLPPQIGAVLAPLAEAGGAANADAAPATAAQAAADPTPERHETDEAEPAPVVPGQPPRRARRRPAAAAADARLN